MKPPRRTARSAQVENVMWKLLTLERLMTSSIAHLVYWMGLGVIALGGFAAIGATVGVALREGDIQGWLLAFPVFITGLLVIGALAILWRSFCELYVVIIRIGDDLNALRRAAQLQGLVPQEEPPPAAPAPEASREAVELP
jgi:hypothetical protein